MRLRRLLAAVATAVALTSFAAPGPAHAAGSRAVVIVDTGGGVHRTVISFSGAISGLEALQLAGANPETVNYGGSLGQAVCKLYGVGNTPAPGQCPGSPYWAYYRSPPGSSGWSYSSTGASNTSVTDGDVEGWKFGNGSAPPYSSFCAVAGCAPPPVVPLAPPPGAVAAAPGAGSGPPGTPGAPNMTGTTAASSSSASTTTTRAPDVRGSHTEARGRTRSRGTTGDGGGGGSPIGIIVGAAVVGGLGAGGFWLRRLRRAAV